MPLRDHFHPPISTRRSWTSVHGGWAFVIAQQLNNGVLPPGFESEQQVHHGTRVEIDVATYEADTNPAAVGAAGPNGTVATAVRAYAPPTPILTGDVAFTDPSVYEIQVYKDDGDWSLVAAIELVSPRNKDRSTSRRAFATKVAAYLQEGVSVVTVDVVTDRQANLHAELVDRLHLPPSFDWQSPTDLSVVVYRVVSVNDQPRLEVWPLPVSLGEALPTVPLWLEPNLAVPLELEPAYETVCRSLHVD